MTLISHENEIEQVRAEGYVASVLHDQGGVIDDLAVGDADGVVLAV